MVLISVDFVVLLDKILYLYFIRLFSCSGVLIYVGCKDVLDKYLNDLYRLSIMNIVDKY